MFYKCAYISNFEPITDCERFNLAMMTLYFVKKVHPHVLVST